MPSKATVHRVCTHCGTHFLARPDTTHFRGPRLCSRDCLYAAQRQRDPLERFWPKVNKDGPVPVHCPELGQCWLWTGAIKNRDSRFPYGAFEADLNNRSVPAHRFIWIHLKGPLAKDIFVCHSCDNTLCVRPDHLFAGTHLANMADMKAKGRVHHQDMAGEKNPRARLNEADVRDVRRRTAKGEARRLVAERYKVCESTIGNIVVGRTWALLRASDS